MFYGLSKVKSMNEAWKKVVLLFSHANLFTKSSSTPFQLTMNERVLRKYAFVWCDLNDRAQQFWRLGNYGCTCACMYNIGRFFGVWPWIYSYLCENVICI